MLDIIIPVYNEGSNILEVLQSLAANVKTPFTVLLCYDRDDDDTLPAVERYSGPPLAIRLIKNQGRGAHGAIMTGFQASTAPAILVFPADDTLNAGILDRMYDAIQGGCAIAAASRFIPGGSMVGCPWLKAFLVRTAAFTLYHVARVPTHDPTNGFRMFSRGIIETVAIESSEGFTYSIELLAKCHRLGYPVAEIPSLWRERTKGKSRFRALKWAPAYLKWYAYAFGTTYLRRGPATVTLKKDLAVSSSARGH
jgi:dolichol-phosphate mannosyltransferase